MSRIGIHPDEHLAEQLEALDISGAELGRRLQVPGNRISQIVSGHRNITGDTAPRPCVWATSSAPAPQFWLNLQPTCDLQVAGAKTGATIKSLPTLERKKHDSNQEQAV